MFVVVFGTGCGGFAARRMAQAPNTYPEWMAPKAPVTLKFNENLLTTFTNQFVETRGARICYRIVEPANYEFRWTNRVSEAGQHLELDFSASIDRLAERTNRWTAEPRGTVVLLHGYGVAGFAMLPWALLLGQEGWRCVLVDLRGHGKSTGKRIFFGTREVEDLEALLDRLEQQGQAAAPVSVVGHSFGAVLALRWKAEDARIGRVVAMGPYADLSRAVLSIADQYAPWVPKWFLKAGLRALPDLLKAEPCELDPGCWLKAEGGVLFVAGAEDKISTPDQVQELRERAGFGNGLISVQRASHEALPFFLGDLAGPVGRWLSEARSKSEFP